MQHGIISLLYAAYHFVCLIKNLILIHSNFFITTLFFKFVFLVISMALVILMHWLSRIVSWLICVLVIVASVGLTGTLWYAYYSIRQKSHANVQISYLEEFTRNEHAVLSLAVLATITMVGIYDL